MIAAAAAGLFHAATALLSNPSSQNTGFKLPEAEKPQSKSTPGEAGTPGPGQPATLTDLQSWVSAQQPQAGTPFANAARALNAYASTSAAAPMRS